MTYQCLTYNTSLPSTLIKDLENEFDSHIILSNSTVKDEKINKTKKVRNSKNGWISTNHWLSGFLWFYVQKANRENFYYDITDIENNLIQFCRYDIGEYYSWHVDSCISNNSNTCRKLSFILQLSDSSEYDGGDIQFLDENDNTYFAPRDIGSITIFDSRTKHRVRKVRKGTRKSIVGWVLGPRWK